MTDQAENGSAPLPQAGHGQLRPAGRRGRLTLARREVSGFRGILRSGEYRALCAGQAQSIAGDQIACVALAVLVYDRTSSPLLTAVTYAGSYLPWLVGGLILPALADRWPRRAVLVTCDLARAALVAAIAIPGMSLPVMIASLYLVSLLDGPFMAARSATYRDILPGDRYRVGIAMASTTFQAAIVAGFAAGGVLVSAIGPRPALVIDAATFAVSALLIRVSITDRPAAGAEVAPVRARVVSGLVLVFTDRRLRACMLLGWLLAFYTVPAALAVPLAASTGGGPAAAGLLFADMPLGIAAGTALYGRCAGAATQSRWMGPLAVGCCGSLMLFLARPGLGWALVILVVSGALGCYQVTANTLFVQNLRRDQQAQMFGIAAAGIWTAQGVAYLAAGAVAQALTPAVAIAIFGAAGAIAAVALTASWRKAVASGVKDARD